MPLNPQSFRARATLLLTCATVLWGISFPVMKALAPLVQKIAPGTSSWFWTSSCLTLRFGMAAAICLAWNWKSLREITRLEMWEGAGLGLFTAAGVLFQMDGLAHTSASTSAFLTQTYCLFLPALVGWRERRWPSALIVLCSAMVMGGVAILARVDWSEFRMGRGELETVVASVIFAGQILWLDRRLFVGNRPSHFTLVMFATMTLVCWPVSLATMQSPNSWRLVSSAVPVLILTAILAVLCTAVAFSLMNRWQPFVSAPEAALIYAAEPVFASLFALFLPGWLSRSVGIDYPNEETTPGLMLGGGLITLANVLVQLREMRGGFRESAVRQA